MGEIGDRITAVNQQLERISIREKSGRLYLRGKRADSFPPKPGETAPRRVELALGVSATPAGVAVAIARAKEADSQLLWGKFDWNDWLAPEVRQPVTIAQWIERYEQHHWQHTPRTTTKQRSFRGDHLIYLWRLSPERELTISALKDFVLSTPPSTRTREKACMAIAAFCEFAARSGQFASGDLADFKAELKSLKRGYQPGEILPEDLPSDARIAEIYESIKNPAWRWVYGMLATYGLRPHEIFHLDLERFSESTDELRVLETTKTGARLTFPCPSVWRSQFRLWDVQLPSIDITSKSNEEIGKKVAQRFQVMKIDHIPYALRHAWCIRTVLSGVPDSVASRWAGHSIQVHVKTYHRAISEAQQRQIFEEMCRRERD